MSTGNGNGGHSARAKLDQIIAEASDDSQTARLATTLTDGLDRLERQFDRATDRFSALVERQAASTMDIFEDLADRFKAVADRVIVLKAEVARLRGQGPAPE